MISLDDAVTHVHEDVDERNSLAVYFVELITVSRWPAFRLHGTTRKPTLEVAPSTLPTVL